MRKWICVLMLAGAVLVGGCSSDSDEDAATGPPNVAGTWTMIANTTFTFDLILTQSGETISGLIDSTNTGDPTDAVTGLVTSSGAITFTRARAGKWTQVYTGVVTTEGSLMTMEGTFTHSGVAGTSPWRANKSAP